MSTLEEKQFYDPRFRPNLYERQFLQPAHVKWFSQWGMDMTGVPVGMPGDTKAAVWRGTFNNRDEAPVLVVVLDRMAELSLVLPSWYAGALACRDIQHDNPELIEIVDAATHGPFVLGDALELLVNFIPPNLYTETES